MTTRHEESGMFAAYVVTFILLSGAAIGTGYVAQLAWNLEAWWQFGLCALLTALLAIGPVSLLIMGIGRLFSPPGLPELPVVERNLVRRAAESKKTSENAVSSSDRIIEREKSVIRSVAQRRVTGADHSALPELIGARVVFLKTHRDIHIMLWVIGGLCLVASIGSMTRDPCSGFTGLVLFGGIFAGTLRFVKAYTLKRPMRMFCPACRKYLPSDLSWVCAKCSTRHDKDNKHSVLNCCKECGTVPSAYQCHHDDCEAIIYLDERYDAEACAYGVGKEGPRMNRRREREEELAEKRHASEMLSIELDGTQKSIQLHELLQRWQRGKLPPAKPIDKSPREMIEEAWAKRYQSLHDLRSYVAQLRDAARAKHGKNTEDLEDSLSDIEDFYQEQLGKYQR